MIKTRFTEDFGIVVSEAVDIIHKRLNQFASA
jgi:hypothetical protein